MLSGRRRRLSVAAVLLTLATVGCGGAGEWPGEDSAIRLPAGCGPPRPVYALPEVSAAERRRLERGVFRVYGYRARLRPPIDWGMDPHRSARFQAYLSNWDFIDPLFAGYRATGDPAFIRQATALALDWTEANPRGDPAGGAGTWSGKITGDRVARLAYLLHAASCAEILDEEERLTLVRSLADHVEVLLGAESAGDTNHALYVQLGLAAAARQLPGLPGNDEILRVAGRRFRRVLEGRLANGVWLEHSTSYQLLAIRVAERFLELTGGADRRLAGRLDRMRDAAAWLTAPDGRETLFGDSRMLPVPPDIRRIAAAQRGLQLYRRAGIAAVRKGDSHLVVSAGFHNTTHKHADELSFELSERGHRVISDTGMYHSDPGAIRDFVVSARAHSTLTVDGRSFPIEDPALAYGSGILAAGSGGGWHAVLASNPLLREQGADHQRLFLYRPEGALVIADRVRSDGARRIDRYLQFGPEVNVRPSGDGPPELTARGFAGALYDHASGGDAELDLARAERRPLAGFVAPDYREWRPRTTVRLRSHARDLDAVATLALDRSRLHATRLTWGPRAIEIAISGPSGPPTRLRVARRGAALRVRVAQPSSDSSAESSAGSSSA